jgi:hypothetical protein
MNAADLDDDARQHLLGLLREQIGESKYQELRRSQTEDQIVDMMLEAGRRHEETKAAARNQAIEYHQPGFFWVIWVAISLLVGAFAGKTIGIMWFCSPFWFLVFTGSSVVPHKKAWMSIVISIVLGIGLFAAMGKGGNMSEGKKVGPGIGGAASAFIVYLISGRMAARRTQ